MAPRRAAAARIARNTWRSPRRLSGRARASLSSTAPSARGNRCPVRQTLRIGANRKALALRPATRARRLPARVRRRLRQASTARRSGGRHVAERNGPTANRTAVPPTGVPRELPARFPAAPHAQPRAHSAHHQTRLAPRKPLRSHRNKHGQTNALTRGRILGAALQDSSRLTSPPCHVPPRTPKIFPFQHETAAPVQLPDSATSLLRPPACSCL